MSEYKVRIHDLIEELCSAEGDSVTILCANPDFEGPNRVVTCNGYWTGYEERRFGDDTLLDALECATTAYRKAGGL